MTEVIRWSCWHQNFAPKGLSAPVSGLYTCIKSWKNVYKVKTSKRFFWKLYQMNESTRGFCWHQNFVPWGLSAPELWLYTFINLWKDVHTVRGRDFFKTCNKWPKWWGLPVDMKILTSAAQRLYTCIKPWKNMHKSRAIFLNMQPSDQSDKTVLLPTKKKCPRGLSPLALGLCIRIWNKMHKIMRQRGSFWNWYKMTAIVRASKCCQNLYQVVVCPCPGAFFKWWPWVDLDHFYDGVKFVSSPEPKAHKVSL